MTLFIYDLFITDPVYLTKTVMHEFCFDYVKPKYCENAKLCYMDKDSIIVHLKTDNVYKNTGEDVERRKL